MENTVATDLVTLEIFSSGFDPKNDPLGSASQING